jgi:lysophospholipase L1-like esterase
MVVKTILIFGDSLTWGSNPEAGGARHARADRWPSMLAEGLGAGFDVITDALRGRSTAYDDAVVDADRNGAKLLPSSLFAHAPLDLVILMLGSNDMKPSVAGSAAAAMLGMKRCAEIVKKHSPRLPGLERVPKLMIVAPPAVVATKDPFYADLFGEKAPVESRKLAGVYAALSVEFECGFFDAGLVAKASPIDGIHLDANNSRAIGTALIAPARALLEHF